MPKKNVLFSFKNYKTRQTLGLCPQTHLPPAAGGSASRSSHQSSFILNSSLHLLHTDKHSRIDKKT